VKKLKEKYVTEEISDKSELGFIYEPDPTLETTLPCLQFNDCLGINTYSHGQYFACSSQIQCNGASLTTGFLNKSMVVNKRRLKSVSPITA
jgi:hypothetical protein